MSEPADQPRGEHIDERLVDLARLLNDPYRPPPKIERMLEERMKNTTEHGRVCAIGTPMAESNIVRELWNNSEENNDET